MNILLLVAKLKPKFFVFGGDNLDMKPFSHWIHSKGDMRTLEGARIREDYENFNNDIQIPLNSILHNCEKHWLKGNHEDWARQAIDRNPQGEGYWEIENNVDLNGWNVYELNEVATIGKMNFIHGIYTNEHHAKKTVTNYESNVFYGHAHDHQSYTKITPIRNEPHIGMSIPCAGKTNPDYNRNKPNKWVTGFLIFEILPDGNFTTYPIIANNGVFSYNGKLYD